MLFFSNRYYKGPVSDHFNGKTFFNKGHIKIPSLLDVLKWKFKSKAVRWPDKLIPDIKPHTHLNPKEEGCRITFIGHSSFLIQINGLNILTDPIYSEYPSPIKTKALLRRLPPGIPFDHLPKIDLILVSHSHYDHCDLPTLKKLYKRDHCSIIVPLGLDLLLKRVGSFHDITALDWGQSMTVKDKICIYLTPAQHWSRRHFFDQNYTLWGGFIIRGTSKQLFFAGDSGYNPTLFKEIADTYGEIDCAMIPIGAYKPRWFMHVAHMGPDEAVLTHLDLKSKLSLAMHHRTFPLTDEGPYEPTEELKMALKDQDIPFNRFLAPFEGESTKVD